MSFEERIQHFNAAKLIEQSRYNMFEQEETIHQYCESTLLLYTIILYRRRFVRASLNKVPVANTTRLH